MSIYLARILADHELVMAEQRAAKERMDLTAGLSGATGADAAEKDGSQDLLRPALSDLAKPPCVSEESTADNQEACTVFAMLEPGNLACDNPAESAAVTSPGSVEHKSAAFDLAILGLVSYSFLSLRPGPEQESLANL